MLALGTLCRCDFREIYIFIFRTRPPLATFSVVYREISYRCRLLPMATVCRFSSRYTSHESIFSIFQLTVRLVTTMTYR